MAEQLPKLDPLDTEAEEKQTTDLIPVASSSEDKTEGYEETGYCSAPHSSAPYSSDVLSGAESSIWTSDDHGSDDTRSHPESFLPKKKLQTSVPIEVSSKPSERNPKLELLKRPSAAKKVTEASAVTSQSVTSELSESLIPAEKKEAASEDSSSRKSKARSVSSEKMTSGLPKLVSLKKTETSQPPASGKHVKTAKSDHETSSKSPSKRLLSGIPMSGTPKKERLLIPLPEEEQAESSENKEKIAKNPTRTSKSKSLNPFSKAKSPGKKTKSVPKQSSSSATDVPSELEKAEKSPVKSKKSPVKSKKSPVKSKKSPVKSKKSSKFSLGKFKSRKQEASSSSLRLRRSSSADETQSSDAQKPTSAYGLVKESIKKIDVSGRLRKRSRKKSEETRLIEKRAESSSPKVTKGKVKSSDVETYKYKYAEDRVESASDNATASWRPLNPLQEGGFLDEDMVACIESSLSETPTEVSTLDTESSSMQKGSKSRRRFTLDSTSKCSSLEEEVIEGASGFQEESSNRPQLLRQTNVEDVDMEVLSEEVFISPIKKVPPQREESEDDDNK